MKHHCNVVVILLALTNFFVSVKSVNYDHVNTTDILRTESSLEEQMVNNSKDLPEIKNLCTLYDQVELINDSVKANYERLFIIIADDMKDAIPLAEFLSDKNRLLPKEKFLFDEIMQNYYLYYSIETSAHILIYPRNVSNEILATYLTKKTIENSKSVKIALTCHQENRDTLNRMFQVAAEILQNTDLKHKPELEQSIIFLPSSVNLKCGYLKAVNSLEEYFLEKFSSFGDSNSLFTELYSNSQKLSVQETLEYHVIEPILTMKLVFGVDELCEMDEVFTAPLRVLVWNYIERNKNLIKFNQLAFSETETLECFQSKLATMIFSDNLDVNMSLTSVFTFFDSVQSTYTKLFFSEYDEKLLEDFCNQREKLEAIKLFCHIRYMSNASNNSKMWISLQHFAEENLQKKLEWFTKLKSLYDNELLYDNLWNETKILQEFQNLYEEIQEIGDNNKNLMKQIFFTVKNNTVTKQVSASCFLMKNKFYKLQIKGEILKFSDIFRNNYCPGKVKFTEVFALDKIIIDEDVTKIGEEVQLNLIAPIWEVVFDRIINLDGVSGENISNLTKITKSENDSPRKIDGSPGLPGGPGGVFFGIYDKLIEGKNLRISSNGGKGGDGENGKKENPPGDGGVSGMGGISGIIEIFSLKPYSSISDLQLSSINGIDGNYGMAGIFQNNEDFLIGKSNHNREGHQQPNKPTILDNFSDSIKRYRKYLVSSTINGVKNTTLEFYQKLNNNPNILNKYKISDFIEDLTNLEKYYSKNMNKSTLLFLLTAWRQGIHEYNLKTKLIDKHAKVLSSLDIIVSRKIQKLEEKFYRHSILRIDAYLEECLTDSLRLRDADVLSEMKSITRKYKMNFESEIRRARKLVQEDLQIYLETKSTELGGSIKQIVAEVDDIVKSKGNEIEQLRQKRVELKNKLMLRSLFACAQFIFLAISFIDPVCAIVGSMLRVGAFVAESEILDKNNSPPPVEIKLPKGVISSMERTFQTYDEKHKQELLFVEKKLVEIEAKRDQLIAIGENAQPLTEAGLKIQEFLSLKSKNSRINPMKRLKSIFQEVSNKWSKKGAEIKNTGKSLKFMQTSVEMDPESIVDLGKETYQKISKDLSEIEQVDRRIEQIPDDLEKLEDFKNRVFQHLEPQIRKIRQNIKTKSAEYAVSSITYLEFEKWHMDEYLTDVSVELESWTKQFTVEESVRIVMKKLKNAVNTIIRLHVLMRDFHLKMKNADHVENIASAPFQLTDIQDGKLRSPLTKLMQRHYANDLLDEYEKWLVAFKQYSFPFVGEFPDVESQLEICDPIVRANFVVEKMKFLKSHLNKRKAEGQLFRHTSTARFGSRGPFSAFYTWTNKKHSTVIKNIFDGKQVKLFANISEQIDLSAVKFRNVNILFVSEDSELEERLKNDLKGFSVALTHNGDSYYRCGDDVYLIESGAFEFGSKFFTRRKRRFVDDKLDFVLSPFATWTVRLDSISGSGDFSVLAKYVNSVNMEIVGEGQYMNSNACTNDFTKYYGEKILFRV